MKIKLTVLMCSDISCGHFWEAQQVLRGGKRWVFASPQALRCPKCGSHRFDISVSYAQTTQTAQ